MSLSYTHKGHYHYDELLEWKDTLFNLVDGTSDASETSLPAEKGHFHFMERRHFILVKIHPFMGQRGRECGCLHAV